MQYQLPQDPAMLMSFLNMKLRDDYGSLEQLCDDLDLDADEILARMKDAGFEYSAENNRFF